MKKIILCIGIVALLSGCGEEEMMMTCTYENTNNGLTNGTEYLVTYTGDEVTNVKITYNYNQNTTTAGDNNGTAEAQTDGVGTGTDGTTADDDTTENDGIVDGVVGDVIIGGIYNTILDLSGLRDMHNNQINNTDIEGFTTTVENNTNNNYKVVYNLDLTKISDDDIGKFNVDRSYKTLRNTYTSQGLTCK